MTRFWRRPLVGLVLVALLGIGASACGLNTSGEPEIVRQMEILALPTDTPTAIPAPTEVPVDASDGGESDAGGVSVAQAEATPEATSAATSEDGAEDAAPESGGYDLGFEVYMRECAVCHGAGDGVGPSLTAMADRAPNVVEGLSAEEYLRQSILDPSACVVDGYQDVMPKDYAETLAEDEVNGLVTFILEFDVEAMMGDGGADSGGEDDAGDTAAALEQDETLVVRGQLVQGTADGETIPAGLPMQLYVLDVHGNLVDVYETESEEGGAYRFENVARAIGNIYLVQVNYDGVSQGAQIAAIEGTEETITQDVTIYERTTDPSSIAITWAQMLINYAPIEQFGLEVWLRVELANTGDRIVTLDETAGPNDWFVSVAIELPVAAFGIQPMQSEGSARYDVQLVDSVPVVKDTWPLRPGQVHTITIAYYLPYEDGAVLDQAFGYPVVDGAVLLPNDTVELVSEQFDGEGEWRYRVDSGGIRVTELQPGEEIDPEHDFTLVKEHPLIKPLGSDERMIFELVGRPTRTIDMLSSTPSSGGGSSNTLPLVLAALGITIIAVALVMWFRQRRTVPPPPAAASADDDWEAPPPAADKEELLRAVADLDDRYERGTMDEELYQERRELLIEMLMPFMTEDE